MPIREFSPKGIPRSSIAFYPDMPSALDLARFAERKFQCVTCTETELRNPRYVALLDAVIFSQSRIKRNALGPVLCATTPMLLNNDVRLYIRIAQDPDNSPVARQLIINALLALNVPVANLRPDERAQMQAALLEREDSLLAPYVYIFDSSVNWIEVAHIVCDHPSGNAPNRQLKLDGYPIRKLGAGGHEERLLLLRRAFYDCSRLHLAPMVDGLSGAPVFKAHATLQNGLAGDWPYLHFVKLGPRKKIADEYDSYIGRALDYVPFHLGPRLRLDRCNLGSSQDILVGDFVEGAEPIRDCAPAGRAGHVIANLFDKTLGPWRKQAKVDLFRTLAQHLEDRWLDDDKVEIKLPPAREMIISSLGGDPAIPPLRAIFNRYGCEYALCGPAHCDLHATNVLVRAGDAIIIDFEKMTDHFPMLYDPASLESGLLVDSFRHDPWSEKSPSKLLELIAPLYTLKGLGEVVTPCHAADPTSWFYDCVTQIRTLSRPAEQTSGQYALVLALCLIRKGSNPQTFKPAQENLRAIAFVLGQRILTQFGQISTLPSLGVQHSGSEATQ